MRAVLGFYGGKRWTYCDDSRIIMTLEQVILIVAGYCWWFSVVANNGNNYYQVMLMLDAIKSIILRASAMPQSAYPPTVSVPVPLQLRYMARSQMMFFSEETLIEAPLAPMMSPMFRVRLEDAPTDTLVSWGASASKTSSPTHLALKW